MKRMSSFRQRVIEYAAFFARACHVSAGVFEHTSREFLHAADPAFCMHCVLAESGACDFRNAHRYGCFEAERWDGLYIYYCPLSLGFIATGVYQEERAELFIVSGPIVIGTHADALEGGAGEMRSAIAALPERTPEEATALSRLQWSLAAHLSGRDASEVEARREAQSGLHNTLYDITASEAGGSLFEYPLEVEKKLQQMIKLGDRQGARELINVLLGRLYFSEEGDEKRLRDNAKGLVVLFSRAAIEGGADSRQIFGDLGNLFDTIDRSRTLESLSLFLTTLFYRFVGYVFDFSAIKHADLVHKVVTFVRAHYMEKITLDDVAAHVHLSRPHVGRVLGEELGQSFTDFVAGFRIEKSRELLANAALSLAEVAELTGFSDQSYFSKVFRKKVGMTPGEYRMRRGAHPRS